MDKSSITISRGIVAEVIKVLEKCLITYLYLEREDTADIKMTIEVLKHLSTDKEV